MISVKTCITSDDVHALAEQAPDKPFLFAAADPVYRATNAVSQSDLKEYRLSPAHYKHRTMHPQEDRQGFVVGRAVHKLALEGRAAFDATYARSPKFDRRTNKGKAEAEEFAAQNAGKEILTEDDYVFCESLAHNIAVHPVVGKYFHGGMAELNAIAYDPSSGVRMKGRADYVHLEKGIIIDLKTTSSHASVESFEQSVRKYFYNVQAAYYTDVFSQASGIEIKGFVFVVIEKIAPFGINAIILDDAWIARGREQYQEWLAMHAKCVERNEWPSYPAGLKVANMPHWM